MPPTITDFIRSDRYLGLGDQACTAVQTALAEIFAPNVQYDEAALSWGIGAGKSFLCSVAIAYMVYRTLCLRSPQAYYGLAAGTTISFANFSVNASHARRVVFAELKQRVDVAPCFQQPGYKRDMTLASELRWPELGVVAFPGNSRETSALGYNMLGAVLDEAAWLDVIERSAQQAGQRRTARYDAAAELHQSLRTRMLSRGNERWRRHALFLMISSPRYTDDFLERRQREAQDNPRVYASRLATWEGAPQRSLSGATFLDPKLGPVPIEFQADFITDPDRARRDLGAIPSSVIGSYLDVERIVAAQDEGRNLELWPDVDPALRGRPDASYFVHVDLALNQDGCGIALGHREPSGVVVDAAARLLPAQFETGEIDFGAIRELIVRLRDECGFNVVQVTYDGWQSVDSRQLLARAGFRVGLQSVDRTLEPYGTLKALLYAGQCRLPANSELLRELANLELIRGTKVDHPARGSKDVADAVAGVVFAAAGPRGQADTTLSFDGQGQVAAPAQPTAQPERIAVTAEQQQAAAVALGRPAAAVVGDAEPSLVGVTVVAGGGVLGTQPASMEQDQLQTQQPEATQVALPAVPTQPTPEQIAAQRFWAQVAGRNTGRWWR